MPAKTRQPPIIPSTFENTLQNIYGLERINLLNTTLYQIMSQKLDQQKQQTLNSQSILRVIDFVQDIITRIGIKLRGVRLLMQDFQDSKDGQQIIRYELPFEVINELQNFTVRELFTEKGQNMIYSVQFQNQIDFEEQIAKDEEAELLSLALMAGSASQPSPRTPLGLKVQDQQKIMQNFNQNKLMELEVIKPEDLIDRFNYLLSKPIKEKKCKNWRSILPNFVVEILDDTSKLDLDQVQCLLILLQSPQHADLIPLIELEQIFQTLGISDLRLEDPQSHLDYKTVEINSIRLVNKFIKFLNNHQFKEQQNQEITPGSNFSIFMKDLVTKQTVKTKISSPEVEIFQAGAFFKRLFQFGIIQSPKVNENICKLLCIDKKYPEILMVKKFKKVIIDFKKSRYTLSIGDDANELKIFLSSDEEYEEEQEEEQEENSNSDDYQEINTYLDSSVMNK